jgi:hypothetical protein
MYGSEVGERGLQVGGLTMRLGNEVGASILSLPQLQKQGHKRVTIFAARSIAGGLVAVGKLIASARASTTRSDERRTATTQWHSSDMRTMTFDLDLVEGVFPCITWVSKRAKPFSALIRAHSPAAASSSTKCVRHEWQEQRTKKLLDVSDMPSKEE